MNINFPLILLNKCGQVLAKVDENQEIISRSKMISLSKKNGITIPKQLKSYFSGKTRITKDDSLFTKAFCTVYYDNVLFRLDCRWKNTTDDTTLTDQQIYKLVKKLFERNIENTTINSSEDTESTSSSSSS